MRQPYLASLLKQWFYRLDGTDIDFLKAQNKSLRESSDRYMTGWTNLSKDYAKLKKEYEDMKKQMINSGFNSEGGLYRVYNFEAKTVIGEPATYNTLAAAEPFETKKDAITAAEEFAGKNPGVTFTVLGPVATVKTDLPVAVKDYDGE